ncbi:hypothetical protein [Hyphobacterium sp.]|uniref:hypothetical protein n=1 Tax=Hyphobacterium sp. TaxID=2004662 RepID=UPI003BA8EEF4
MSSLSEKQLESLSILWTAISPDMRGQLRRAAGSIGKLADIFAQLDAETGVPSHDTVLFRIFSDVTGTAGQPPTHARFSSEQLQAISQLSAPDSANSPDSSDVDAMQAWRTGIAASIKAAVERAQSDKSVLRQLKNDFGDDYEALLADACTLLENDRILYDALKPFPDAIQDLPADLVVAARDAHEHVSNEAPDASLWLLKILTARLEKTAQIFRVVEKIGRRSDDALVSKTDLADIGDLVLANAAFYADQLADAPQSLQEARAAGNAVAEYVKISVGMTREFGIRKDGHWGKSLFRIRARASSCLEHFFSQFEKSFPRALPYPEKGRRGVTRAGRIPAAEIVQQAEAGLCLLAATGHWATQAAIASAQKQAADLVRNELDKCASGLLEVLRNTDDEDSDQVLEAIALVVRYMRAFADDENASLIQRRSAAVRSSAA